jgi:hypothetical protein
MKVRRTNWIGMLASLTLGMASTAFAEEIDPFAAGLVPGEPLAEEELALFEGKGLEATTTGTTRPENGPAGAPTSLHEQAETRVDAAVERMQGVEDRLSDGVGAQATGAVGPVGDSRINATDIESRMSDRLDTLVDHAFDAETRTHWTIWH